MIESIATKRDFFGPPVDLSRVEQRFFVLWTVLCPVGAAWHLLMLPLFVWMGLPVMVVHSLLGAAAWLVALWLGRRGLIHEAIALAGLEVCLYAALATWQMGWASGAAYLLLPTTVVAFLFPLRRWFVAFWILIPLLEFILLNLLIEQVTWQGNPAVLAAIWVMSACTMFGVIALMAGYQANLVRSAEQAMEEAYAQSEALLNNVMPQVIAERLKRREAIIADTFPGASVLFADIVNFTPLSQSMTADEVVFLLDDLFSRIDVLVRQHGLEKIKTIGDAYMVAAGVPVRRDDHAQAMAAFALDLQALLKGYNGETGRDLKLRIGINSGPVVAGVIGRLRFLYDLWGDSVNTASRMESYGVPGEIQVTEATRLLLGEQYLFEDRGMVDIKGKGLMQTYLLRARQVVANDPVRPSGPSSSSAAG